MSEWIRHRGSKTMPKRLEGVRFEVRYRNGEIANQDAPKKEGFKQFDWELTNHEYDILAYRILEDDPRTAPAFLQSALQMLTQRGKDYDKPEGERSAAAVALAFNAITGRNLTEAEVWLVLQLVKDVRQWQNPGRYHADSALDCVAYAALKAEALAKGGE